MPATEPATRRRLVVVAVAVACLVVAFGAVAFHRRGSSHQLVGIVTLHDPSTTFAAHGCRGSGGYDDIGEGAPVTVSASDGHVVAVALLDRGDGQGHTCLFTFTARVPQAAIYQVEVAHRGIVPFSRSELQARHWSVDLAVGG